MLFYCDFHGQLASSPQGFIFRSCIQEGNVHMAMSMIEKIICGISNGQAQLVENYIFALMIHHKS